MASNFKVGDKVKILAGEKKGIIATIGSLSCYENVFLVRFNESDIFMPAYYGWELLCCPTCPLNRDRGVPDD